MKKLMVVVSSAALLAACGGDGDDNDAASLNNPGTNPAGDRDGNGTPDGQGQNGEAKVLPLSEFLRSEFQEGRGEILLSQLALERATDPAVQDFAQLMLDHHTRANEELQALATERQVSLPTEAASDYQARADELQALSGAEFDRAYMQHNVAVHDSEVSQYVAMLQAAVERDIDDGSSGGSGAGGTEGAGTNGADTNGSTDNGANANGSADAAIAAGGGTAGQDDGATDDGELDLGLAVFLTKMKVILSQHLGMAKEINGEINPNAWLMNAWQDGLAEVELSRIALERAETASVKEFAQRMIDDHTNVNNLIEQVARSKNVTLPDRVTAEQRVAARELAELEGAIFDKAYMNHNVIVHTLSVRQTEAQSSTGEDPDVRALATRALEPLQAHLQEATTIYQALPEELLLGAWTGGLGEILLSSLALERASAPEVREFAQMMVDDHTRVNTEVARLADERERFLPIEPAAEAAQAFMALSRLTGDEFDQAYMESNVSAHEKAVALFTDSSQNESDTELRAFATQTLPVLNGHLDEARTLRDRVTGGNGGTDGSGAGGDAAGAGAGG